MRTSSAGVSGMRRGPSAKPPRWPRRRPRARRRGCAWRWTRPGGGGWVSRLPSGIVPREDGFDTVVGDVGKRGPRFRPRLTREAAPRARRSGAAGPCACPSARRPVQHAPHLPRPPRSPPRGARTPRAVARRRRQPGRKEAREGRSQGGSDRQEEPGTGKGREGKPNSTRSGHSQPQPPRLLVVSRRAAAARR